MLFSATTLAPVQAHPVSSFRVLFSSSLFSALSDLLQPCRGQKLFASFESVSISSTNAFGRTPLFVVVKKDSITRVFVLKKKIIKENKDEEFNSAMSRADEVSLSRIPKFIGKLIH
ncbi:MAG: hypothetical protein KGH81_02575 [Thaumarchaeota archaeon]|nr:hypothetical protein [Nitrososphaerota archaeon]